MNIGFVGCGKMGEAIVRGLKGHTLFISRRNQKELQRICDAYGAKAVTNTKAAACEVVFLCVKPQQYEGVLKEIEPCIQKDALFVYLAPGFTVPAMIEKTGGRTANLIHLMPNTPCAVGAGVLAYAVSGSLTEAQEQTFLGLLRPLGELFKVQEKDMNAVVGISGSSPAYFYMMIDALAMAGVRAGLTRAAAEKMAAQTMKGCAEMILQSGQHPSELRDAVCSPGGTTIEAVYALEKAGFGGIVMDAAAKCIEKCSGIG